MDFLSPNFLLLLSLVIPMTGAGLIWLLCARDDSTAPGLALMFSLVTLAAAAGVVFQFPTSGSEEIIKQQSYGLFEKNWLSFGDLSINFSIGLDGLGLWLYGLSALLVVTSVLVSWESVKKNRAGFYALLMLLECGMLGVFIARDLILFYVFFEFTLIPLFFLIGVWGSDRRRYAAIKFFLFTLAGSVLTFLGLLTIALWYETFSIPQLTAIVMGEEPTLAAGFMDSRVQAVIFVALFAGFAIKVPLFPCHTWLPLAHVEAPTAGSILLAGVLLKIGTYGFLRFSIPLLPDATAYLMPYLLWLSVAGIVYGALVALAQSDIKRLIAYSSVSHMGFCMLGIFALTRLGVQGGALQAINHGISTGGLFAVVGMIYRRYHTREIRELGGLARRIPVLAFFMVFFTLSSIGLPGLNGFAGEFLLLCGVFQRAFELLSDSATAEYAQQYGMQFMAIAVLAVSGVVLGAWYMLWLVQRVFFGPLKEPQHDEGEEIKDISWYELGALVPLAVFAVWIGLAPQFFLERMSPTLERLTEVPNASWDIRLAETDVDQGETPEGSRQKEQVVTTQQEKRSEQASSRTESSPKDSTIQNKLTRLPTSGKPSAAK